VNCNPLQILTIEDTVRMLDEHSLMSRQADQLWTDIANVEGGLEIIMERVVRLPTRRRAPPNATASEIGTPVKMRGCV
jgi:hypothetical protein